MSDVLILGEVREGSLDMKILELLEAGKKLSTDLGVELSVVLVGDELSEVADQVISYGKWNTPY
jgi:hypothetical protein